ncbi:MAG: DUF4288 domain-containing protein [Candidatus Omnitrophica bacterium]|nr:DUF4288 domain-containing protein [Candidatus Omnitrophota bacterium]
MTKKFYAVKTVYRIDAKGKPEYKDKYFKEKSVLIEERILLVRADNQKQAIQKAETEARKYSKNDNVTNVYGQKVLMSYTGICDSFELYDEPENNVEIFSSTRVLDKELKKDQLADLMLGKAETKKGLMYRRKFRSK